MSTDEEEWETTVSLPPDGSRTHRGDDDDSRPRVEVVDTAPSDRVREATPAPCAYAGGRRPQNPLEGHEPYEDAGTTQPQRAAVPSPSGATGYDMHAPGSKGALVILAVVIIVLSAPAWWPWLLRMIG